MIKMNVCSTNVYSPTMTKWQNPGYNRSLQFAQRLILIRVFIEYSYGIQTLSIINAGNNDL